jgi:hypothetical protein
MKLQFSLATLLVCVTVLGVVCALCVQLPVHKSVSGETYFFVKAVYDRGEISLPPTNREIAWRLAWSAPLSIVGTLAGLWIVRRLKSRCENGRPVG